MSICFNCNVSQWKFCWSFFFDTEAETDLFFFPLELNTVNVSVGEILVALKSILGGRSLKHNRVSKTPSSVETVALFES